MTQSKIGEGVTTFTEDFAQMERWITSAGGAGATAVMGTVGGRFEAIYGFTNEQPPRIVQISLTGHARLTATVSVVSVTEDDEPAVWLGRFTYGHYVGEGEEGASAQEIFDRATDERYTPGADVHSPDKAAAVFDTVYANLEVFTPKP